MSTTNDSNNSKKIYPKKKKGVSTIIDVMAGKIMKEYRVNAGFVQSVAAVELSISFQQLQKYESGKNRMSTGMLAKCFKLFKISAEEFFTKLFANEKRNLAMEERGHFEGCEDQDDGLNSKNTLKLVKQYYKLSQTQRKKIIALMRTMTESDT